MASPAADDYLKTVYAHTEWQDEPITPKVLAGKLGIAPSSVTEMVKKLAKSGLVSHVPYGAVQLTEAGRDRALAMVRRHRLIETWLVRTFDYTWDEVHDEAEVLEHAISDRLLAKIDAELGHPRFDPHGDAIPDADLRIRRVPFVLLGDAPVGHRGSILRVSDYDPDLLRAMDDAGLHIDAEVEVLDTGVSIQGRTVAVPPGATRAVWLTL